MTTARLRAAEVDPLAIHPRRVAARTALIRAIHAAARRHGLSDDERRALQRRVTGQASLTDMTPGQLRDVLTAIDPARPNLRAARRTQDAGDKARLLHRMRALLAERGADHEYALAILRHMFPAGAPQVVEWASVQQLRRLVAALEIDRRRRAAKEPVR